jgi:hypothetical protein
MAAFLVKMAPHAIHRQAGGATAWVHLYLYQLHLHPKHHLVIIKELKCPKSKVCHWDMSIYLIDFRTLSISIMTFVASITNAIKISFQVYLLINEQQLATIQSAAW